MNLFWLDASALAKRYVPESGTPLMNDLFARVPRLSLLCLLEGVGEVVSVLVRRRNAGTITAAAFQQAMVEFRSEVSHDRDLEKVRATDHQVTTSWRLIERHSLNSTDAIILRCALDKALALRLAGHDLILVSSDGGLVTAAQAEGLLTLNPETASQADLDRLIIPFDASLR
ncbi:MAG: type II toxin-antitoxin system VapC family toxin [Planctomycetes bacterium]|nr:type II toxin-antitoxin system VapC family toxin [Planctomycetota bacterium]